jgi:hypothetical protein
MTAEMDPVEKRLMYIRYFLVTIKPIVFAIFIVGKRFTIALKIFRFFKNMMTKGGRTMDHI